MSDNRTFFKNAQSGKMSLGDIFSDVTRRHSPEDMARSLTAGTALTTPRESEMLATWQKPFVFARFFCGCSVFLIISYMMGTLLDFLGGYYLLMFGIPLLIPITLLLLVWEMNVPGNISLYEIVKVTAFGGALSLFAAILGFVFSSNTEAIWAGLIEEPAKLIVIYIILHNKNYKYTTNGILIGTAVGTGFAIMESLIYVINAVGEGMAVIMTDCANDSIRLSEVLENYGSVWYGGIVSGIYVGISRAVTSISGHGIFAALYAGALVKAKGNDELRISHILNPEFLLYFAASILLHALHNYGLDLGLPVLANGMLPSEYVIIAIIALCLLLNIMRLGVNQAVSISIVYNDGRITKAVNRDAIEQDSGAERKDMVEKDSVLDRAEFRLIFISGPFTGKKYRIHDGQAVTLGRASGTSDIVLTGCENVSGSHCRIRASGDRITVTDLNSTNGTYLDNQRLAPNQEMRALNGSTVCLGNKDCAFQITMK